MRSVLWPVIVVPFRRERRGTAVCVLPPAFCRPHSVARCLLGWLRPGIVPWRSSVRSVDGGRWTSGGIDLDDELLASVAKELGTSTKKDTVNAALREVMASRRRAVALTRLRDAATDGAFDLAVLQDKQRYRR
jgi:Arc/MetJ family transcription regulator